VSDTKVSVGFRKRVYAAVERAGTRVVTTAAGVALEGIFLNTPEEDGHMHRAWLEAAMDIPELRDKALQALAASGIEKISNDPKAYAAGSGTAVLKGLGQKITLKNGLGFAKTLEYGGTQFPIAPGGSKEDPVMRPPGVGPLYGPRKSTGRAFIVWKDASGRTHKAPWKHFNPGRFVGKALKRTKDIINRRMREQRRS
jgi:hypothetical protein